MSSTEYPEDMLYFLSNFSTTSLPPNDTVLPPVIIHITPVDTSPPYGGEYFEQFQQWYTPIHGYVALFLCVFGILANACNMLVLTRKNMVSPTNMILGALALANMATMIVYVPFVFRWNFLRESLPIQDVRWVRFLLAYANTSVTCYTISMWLNVSLAIFQYVTVRWPTEVKCTTAKAWQCIAASCVLSIISCIPNYMTYVTYTQPYTYPDKNGTVNVTMIFHHVGDRVAAQLDQSTTLRDVNFWCHSVLLKLLPCCVLTILIILIVRNVRTAMAKRQQIVNRERAAEAQRQCERTTRMLVAVLVIFITTVSPIGIISMITGILGEQFLWHVYYRLGDLFDLLSLLCCALNFVIYCTMSRQFRDTFKSMFCAGICRGWLPRPGRPQNPPPCGNRYAYVPTTPRSGHTEMTHVRNGTPPADNGKTVNGSTNV